MSGFTAVNIGMRIPGMLGKLKQLAELPLRLVMASAESGEHDGVMGLVRSASHLFNLIMGRSCGQQRLKCTSSCNCSSCIYSVPGQSA